MDSAAENLTPAATLRILQSIAADDSMLPSIGRFTYSTEPGGLIRTVTSASALYENDYEASSDVIDLRDTNLPLVAPEVVLSLIPAISLSNRLPDPDRN